jgi:translocation and assembly module TamB
LTAARQISKDLTITYSTNIASDPNQVLAVEYRVSNRMSFVAQYEQGSQRNLSTRSNNYSFEIRFRKRF